MGKKKGRVLCVDDEPNILRSLQWLLQRDFDVMTAPSGIAGLELVRHHDFDVVVSDQRMPGMIGSEFLREVSRISPRAMRILLTGYSDMQAILRSVNESEVFRFINKPWSISELPKVVGEAASIAQATVSAATAQGDEALHAQADGIETILIIDDDPDVATMLRESLDPGVAVIHVRNLAEAVDVLCDKAVGVIVSETRVAGSDATRLLKMLKQQHPDIVTVVISGATDAEEVIELINQGQIYRFVPKPIKPGFFKIVVTAAALKRHQIRLNPQLVHRHTVERLSQADAEALRRDVHQLAEALDSGHPTASAQVPFMQRVAGGFRRLFGMA